MKTTRQNFSRVSAFVMLAAFVLLGSCEPADNRLKFKNKTGKPIYYIWSNDTVNWINNHWHEILNDSTVIFSIPGKMVWEAKFERDEDHIKHLYVFEEERIYRYERDTIKGNIKDYYQYNKRIDVTLEDLEKMNWIIVVR